MSAERLELLTRAFEKEVADKALPGVNIMVARKGRVVYSRAVGAPSMVIDNTMIKLVARAHRWQQLLLQGVYASIEELAQAEAINPSYVSRVMRLSCLAPSITEAIMEGQHPAHLTAKELLAPFPLAWAAQREHFKLG
jgi:hypothetical protein